jgi:RecQ-mediated genome instability protein 1
MASPANVAQEVTSHLASKSLKPTGAWLNQFVSSGRPSMPLPALKQTALFRILASDIRKTLQSSSLSVFPADVLNANIKDRKLAGPIPVQILDIEDLGKSRWSQVEELEAAEKGETTKGREIIRVIPGEDGANSTAESTPKSAGPHKVVLQDAKGTTVFGFELTDIAGLDVSMNIGAKLILRDVTVARGVLFLEPRTTQLLGGKIEALHKSWKEGRKETLKTAAGISNDAS